MYILKIHLQFRRFFCTAFSVFYIFSTVLAYADTYSADKLSPYTAVAADNFREKFHLMSFLLSHTAANKFIKEQIENEIAILGSRSEWEKLRILSFENMNDPEIAGNIAVDIPGLNGIKIVKVAGLLAHTGQFAHVGLSGKNYNGVPVAYVDSIFYKKLGSTLLKHETDEIKLWEQLRNILDITDRNKMRAWIINNVNGLDEASKMLLRDTTYSKCKTARDIAKTIHEKAYDMRALYALVDMDSDFDITDDDLHNIIPVAERFNFDYMSKLASLYSDDINIAGGEDNADELCQSFVENVFKPVSGIEDSFPNGVSVEITVENGIPTVKIAHAQIYDRTGEQVNFIYRIIFDGDKVTDPDVPLMNRENLLTIPRSGITDENIMRIRDAWRRMTIADPVLYKRFRLSRNNEFINTPYQDDAVNAGLKTINKKGHALIVMATGTGKTRVAMEIADRFTDNKNKRPESGKKPGVVLFMVNNKTILSEAEEKLYEYYGDKFKGKVGRIYEGEESYNDETEFIFATPASLALSNSSRLERLIKAKKIDLAIFDETHHIPANMTRMIHTRLSEESVISGYPCAFLGFTATETRPDRASVIEFFGSDIAYEYRITRAWNEGYLSQIKYETADQDIIKKIGLDPSKINMIEPGSETETAYHAEIYSESRYAHLLQKYHEATCNKLDKRTLILAPTIDDAQKLAAFFNEPSEGLESVRTVTLTSKDKDADEASFYAAYNAWKNPDPDHPGPQVVIAVDMFREGIDAPGINTLILWADTNSTIRYIQSIGRGLRPSPFKTHITVVDAVGIQRKAHVLQYLGTLLQPGHTRNRTGKDDEDEDLFDDYDFDEDVLENSGIHFSEDRTEDISNILGHVPLNLEMLYGYYPLIPLRQRIRLDNFIVRECGFIQEKRPSTDDLERGRKLLYDFMKSIASDLTTGIEDGIRHGRQNFYHFLKSVSNGLASGISDNDAKTVREILMPAFFVPGLFEKEDLEEKLYIPECNPTRIVFERIQDLIYRQDPDLTE